MTCEIDICKIHNIAAEAKPDITEYLNCGYINRHIRDALVEHTRYNWKLIDGCIQQDRGIHEEHSYVMLPREDSPTNYKIIVDGALKQFCEENKGKVWIALDKRQKIPDVAVTTPHQTMINTLNEYTDSNQTTTYHKHFNEWSP